MTHLVAGIDPDAFGAVALMDRNTGVLVEVIDMPQANVKPARLVDLRQLAAILDEWSPKIGEVYVEKAWARPNDPPSFAFRVGHNYGGVCGVINAHFIRLHTPSPQAWKKAIGVTSDKETSRQEASIRYPAECRRWALKKHHGRAEAVLLAAYGRSLLLREAA
jgi:crossover junction endodeoxyribonuclease RuvC